MQRRTARENAFILIFESIFKADEVAEEIFVKATQIRGLEYDDYVKEIFFGSYENSEVIDSAVERHLTGWKKERISPVSRSRIRALVTAVESVPRDSSISSNRMARPCQIKGDASPQGLVAPKCRMTGNPASIFVDAL